MITEIYIKIGQMIAEEIVDTQHAGFPWEYFNMPVPKGHPLHDPYGKEGEKVRFLRTQYDQNTGKDPSAPRQQVRRFY